MVCMTARCRRRARRTSPGPTGWRHANELASSPICCPTCAVDCAGLLKRSPYLAAIPTAIAIALAALRWLIQGSGNVYTTLAKRFYVPDPDLGWRVSGEHPIWLGLEVIGVMAGIAAGLAGAAWVIRR